MCSKSLGTRGNDFKARGKHGAHGHRGWRPNQMDLWPLGRPGSRGTSRGLGLDPRTRPH